MSRERLVELQTALQTAGWTLTPGLQRPDLFQLSRGRLEWQMAHPGVKKNVMLKFRISCFPGCSSQLKDVMSCSIAGTKPLMELPFLKDNDEEWGRRLAGFVAGICEGSDVGRARD